MNCNLSCPPDERGPVKSFSSEPGHVYIVEDENNIIKIGHSMNPTRRIKQIQYYSGLCVMRQHISPLCYNHLEIEKVLLIEFADYLKQGEHLQGVAFEEVCAALDKQPFLVVSPATSTTESIPFQFQNNYSVRVILDEQGNPFFVAKDTCNALRISKYRDAVAKLDPDERVSMFVDTLGGTQKMTCVSESGLYHLIFMSDKPEAKVFRRWVTHEVLPQIRQKGYYSLYGQVTPSTQSLVNEIAQTTVTQITQALAPLTQNPVVVVKSQEDGTVKKVEVSFRMKLSFEIKEV